MSEQITCPRRMGEFGPWDRREGQDRWREDGTCSFCESISGAAFLEAVKAGAPITPTDKDYKAYIRIPNPKVGQRRIMGTSNAEKEGEDWVPVDAEVRKDLKRDGWQASNIKFVLYGIERETQEAKFYFQHLSEEERAEFIRLHNERAMRFEYPGHFYRLPFFCAQTPEP